MKNTIKEKFKVVKELKACELLGCKRTKFHEDYKPKLKIYKAPNGYHTFYSLKEVEKLVEKNKLRSQNILDEEEFEIVE